MAATLADILDERFAELGVGPAAKERAAKLKEDRTTLSKIVNGSMSLTRNRADNWAAALFRNRVAAGEFADRLMEAAQRAAAVRTMNEFCDEIGVEGGAAGERVADLLESLLLEKHPLVVVEYRDLPRAGRAGKYEALGPRLGEAIARGLTFCMFQPFGAEQLFPPADRSRPDSEATHSYAAATYMRLVRDKCRSAYQAFHRHAENALEKLRAEASRGERSAIEALARDTRPMEERIRLYERKGRDLCGGIQSNLFYIEWIIETNGVEVREQRLFQWVPTPAQDLLIYRGRDAIELEAIRDTYFPIPHAFALDHALVIPTEELYTRLEHDLPERMELPYQYRVWDVSPVMPNSAASASN